MCFIVCLYGDEESIMLGFLVLLVGTYVVWLMNERGHINGKWYFLVGMVTMMLAIGTY